MRSIYDEDPPQTKSEIIFKKVFDELLNYREKLHNDYESLKIPHKQNEVKIKYHEVMELLKILISYNYLIIGGGPALENDQITYRHFNRKQITQLLVYPETNAQQEIFNNSLNQFFDAFINGRKDENGNHILHSGMVVLESRRGHNKFLTKILDLLSDFTNNVLGKITGKDVKARIFFFDIERKKPESEAEPIKTPSNT